MANKILTTRNAVIDALGGVTAVAKLTGRRHTNTVSNWRNYTPTFPANTYLVMTEALGKINKSAPPSLWGMAA